MPQKRKKEDEWVGPPRPDRRGSHVAGFDRAQQAEEALPPEPGDLADRAQQASLDLDEQGDVGGDQDIDTAGTDADVNEDRPLSERTRKHGARPQH